MYLTLKLSGLHCVSCSLSIDGELEDLPGVKSSNTNYAKSESKVEFDEQKISQEKIISTIEALGYEVNML